MSFLYPGMALAAIASVAVPVLIHLLLRRRKRVIRWAAMDLLERAMRRDRRRQRLERWLLLVARCLLLAVAGLALAQPLVDAASRSGGVERTLWLVIDDGVASAEVLPDGTTVLERSADEARRAVADLAPGDRVGVITASQPARRLVDPPTADLARIESLLGSIEPAWTGSDLPLAMRDAARAAGERESGRTEILLLSAFRRGSLDLASAAPVLEGSLPRGTRLLASAVPPGGRENGWITEVEPLRLGDEGGADADRPMRVRLERGGSALPRLERRVTAASTTTSAADVIIDAGERRASVDMRLRREPNPSAGPEALRVSLDADAQPRDDERFVLLPSEQPPRVLVLDRRSFTGRGDLERLSSGAWMARALEPGRGGRMQVDEIDPASLDRTLLGRAEVVIIARPDLIPPDGWTQLRRFVGDGGAVIVAPAPDESGQRWVEAFRRELAPSWRIEAEVEVVADGGGTPWRLAAQQPSSAALRMLGSELSLLAAPVTTERRLRAEAPVSDAEPALLFEDGVPLVLAGRGPAQRGWVALLATAPELGWTDLVVRPLMVPLMQELVRQGRALARFDEMSFAGTRVAAPSGASRLQRRVDATSSGGASLLIGADGRTTESVMRPGLYDARDDAGRLVGVVAVNVDRKHASIELNAAPAVQAWLRASGAWAMIGDESSDDAEALTAPGASWSFALLIAAACIALGEMVLAWLLSRSAPMEVRA